MRVMKWKLLQDKEVSVEVFLWSQFKILKYFDMIFLIFLMFTL